MTLDLFWTKPSTEEVKPTDPLGLDAMREELADKLVPYLTGRTHRHEDFYWCLTFIHWSSSSLSEKERTLRFLTYERWLKLCWAHDGLKFAGSRRANNQALESGAPHKQYVPVLKNQRSQGLLGAHLQPLRRLELVRPDVLKLTTAGSRMVEGAGTRILEHGLPDGAWDKWHSRFENAKRGYGPQFKRQLQNTLTGRMPLLPKAFARAGWRRQQAWIETAHCLGPGLAPYARLAGEFIDWADQVRAYFEAICAKRPQQTPACPPRLKTPIPPDLKHWDTLRAELRHWKPGKVPASHPVPGIILGDEVGMGKTYEVFGVIAALLRHKPNARIVVLAHNASMSEIWRNRWEAFAKRSVAAKFRQSMPAGETIYAAGEIGKPGILFGSYEIFKRASTPHQRAILEWALTGSGLHRRTRKRLRRQLFGTHATGDDLSERLPGHPSQHARRSLLTLLTDDATPPHRIYHELRRLVLRCFRTRRPVDLLVVDEAHKVPQGQRELFFTEVLDRRADKVLYVTATPFALDLDELVDLIQDMFDCAGADTSPVDHLQNSLDQFREIVDARGSLSQQAKLDLQKELGNYLVRSCWPPFHRAGPHRKPVRRRALKHLTTSSTSSPGEGLTLANLALETAFRRLQDENARTHRANHRETLCSSYAAIREAAKDPEKRSPFVKHLRTFVSILPANQESPKFDRAVEFLLDMARRRRKVVVFCKRLATVHKLHNDIHRALQAERLRAGKVWQSALRKLSRHQAPPDAKAESKLLTRMAIYATGHPARPASPSMRRRFLEATSKAEPKAERRQDFLKQTWGPRRRIDWVADLTGDTHYDQDGGRSREAVQFAFNLPAPPYILLCTNIAREGIDLHHCCRHIMHYDLEWNPASMEQQVGRLDRLGSYSFRAFGVHNCLACKYSCFVQLMSSPLRDRNSLS